MLNLLYNLKDIVFDNCQHCNSIFTKVTYGLIPNYSYNDDTIKILNKLNNNNFCSKECKLCFNYEQFKLKNKRQKILKERKKIFLDSDLQKKPLDTIKEEQS